ncbi:MAG: D-glycero-beta-D-manno-heptose 1,7-bisphosphate 7-phosphatase [Actinobacteria bacterium]|nr:D-glycero-beta-D-manno-heptose 1,7-bisphosphate 7-phosphatase [Actinomycetota bacterium]
MARGAVFIDRDGTINKEVGYLSNTDDMVLLPRSVEAIKRLNEAGLDVFVITNQAGVARGYFDENAVREIHKRLRERLADGGAKVKAIYYCPHHPDFPNGDCEKCACRKPNPGMLLMAARDHDVDLSLSYMIGDTVKDVETGQKAGCRSILVLTGYGREEQDKLKVEPDYIADDLMTAADWILS